MEGNLSHEEYLRYDRHLRLGEIGVDGQKKIQQAKVLVIGAGGLGCPVLQYLVAAGVGSIGIVDADVVEVSNLQRQILFNTEDVGKHKAVIATQRLERQNPLIDIIPIVTSLNKENALEIIKNFDIILDGSDNFPTRYLVNDACVILKKPLVFGSIFKFEGQFTVFNYKGGPTYRCLFPEPPAPHLRPSCSDVGVLGVLPGLIGLMMATETLKIILQIGQIRNDNVLIVDTLTNNQTELKISVNPTNQTLVNLEDNYQIETDCIVKNNQITPSELNKRIESDPSLQVLDVRESFELAICAVQPCKHIPLKELPDRLGELNQDGSIVVLCHHGVRSQRGMELLQAHGFTNVVNLQGGIDAWAVQVDLQMPRY